jgi:hypothetical protein
MSETENLNEYEKLRYDKIKRNEQKLKDLGLDKLPKQTKQKKSGTKRKASTVPSEPTRRSSRKQNKSLNYNQNDEAVDAESESNETDETTGTSPSDKEESSDDGEYEEEGIDVDGVEEYDVELPVKRERKTKVEPSQAEDQDQAQVDSTGGLTLERAKSGRSTCKKCKNIIDKGSPRVGMKAWIVGRQAMTWQCPECFLNNLTCGYETSGRTRCKATDAAFVKGELKVGARSHTAKAFYKMSAIGSVLGSVVAFMLSHNSKLPNDFLQVQNIEGHEKLSPSDRSSLQSVLNNVSGKQQSSSETQNLSVKRTKVDDKKVKGETEEKAEKSMEQQPKLGSKSGAKGRVQWKFGGHTCYGTLLPSQETKTHCFARTHKGNTKTLAKGKDYWSMLSS